MENDADIREQVFHNTVRENIIFLLLFLALYLSSYAIILRFKRQDRDDYFTNDEDEATVYRISLWLCTFSLAVSVGAVLLLPISIASNEVLILYPDSYYVKWLNSSLIQGLWNHIFLFSNLSLFIFLPFAYLFTESEGFAGYRKGIMAKVYESFTVLFLLAVLVFGMTYILSAIIDSDRSSIHTLLNIWNYYLPFLYSCISFLGVVMLLLCTPLGFGHLFTVVGRFLVKPQFLRDVDKEFYVAQLEEDSLRRYLRQVMLTGKSCSSPPPMCPVVNLNGQTLHNGAVLAGLKQRLHEIQQQRILLDKQRHTSSLRRNLLYPLAMLVLLSLTLITALIVIHNSLELLVGIKALPLSTRQFTLGIASLSKLGPIGAAMEIVLIFYLVVTSTVGLYTIPLLSAIQPKYHETPISHIILNCGVVLILSSAIPLLSRILGITNFDLLGDFGEIEWLGNFVIVLFYNLGFVAAAALSFVNKFTATVRKELCVRLKSVIVAIFNREDSPHSSLWSNSPISKKKA